MKSDLKQKAAELGFEGCRFTTAQPPETGPRFEAWLAAGRQGEMGYLQRNAAKRVDPQLVLPGARSILTLAASYAEESPRFSRAAHPAAAQSAAPDNSEARVATEGVIARYAQFEDYHEVLGERLAVLARFLESLGGPGTRALWYVDTGPILERDLAQRAGLGFVGKHTNLISRQLGNWFFLAEILTTLALDPDPPEKNRCGQCSRCLEACPTQAITAPFVLDARRCISYLTIECKGSIPVELRRGIGNRIFGCDDCLAACPWNRFAREGKLMQEHARGDLRESDLVELLGLDEDGFRRRFEHTPILRTKRRGLLRNVCVALGNVGDAAVLPALRRACEDLEPLIREHARWAVEQIENRAGKKA